MGLLSCRRYGFCFDSKLNNQERNRKGLESAAGAKVGCCCCNGGVCDLGLINQRGRGILGSSCHTCTIYATRAQVMNQLTEQWMEYLTM